MKEKRQQVRDALERIGHLQGLDVLPTLGTHTPWHYRNKMQFPVAAAGKSKVAIGCFAAATHEVIDVTDCAIQKEGNNAIVAVVRQWMKDFKIPAYDEDARTGIVRHIMGRVGVHTGEIMVCLVTACDMVPHMKDLVQRLRRDIPGLTSVVQNVNKRHTNVILGPKTKTVYGKGTIHDSIGPLTFHISAQSFFQVNSEQAQRLYETALDFADLKGGETVADVYCGTGTITLFLAQKAKFVRGVEIVPQAIDNARANAKLNGIENVEFFVGKAEEVLPREYEKNGVYADVIVVDPPRKGCDEVLLNTILKMKPERVVYVSCDSATLARDLKVLCAEDYELMRVSTTDMFPQGVHVETVVLLSRKTPDDTIEVDLDLDELDITSAESKATYQEIKDYVLKEFGLKVSTLYISQIKRKCGIEVGEHYNISQKENQKVPQCPKEKEDAIRAALEHFAMI